MEIKADDLNLSTIKKIFSLKDDDPKLYRPYKVTKKEYDFLVRYKKELESYPVSKFDLYLETYSVKK